MSIIRIKNALNSKTTATKHQKREIANLLELKKVDKARIKCESIITDDNTIESYEILELMCELLHERIKQVTNNKNVPDDLKEAIASVIWSSNQVTEELPDH
jgi:hypothetical protein